MQEPSNGQPVPQSRRGFLADFLVEWHPVRILHFLLRPQTRWAICWLIAFGTTGVVIEEALRCFNDRERADGNWGHASIDFGGQWVMGRMIVEGSGRQLYNRNYLRPIVEGNYPDGVESKKSDHTDAVNLLSWLSGEDDPEAPNVVASLLTPLAGNDVYGAASLLAASQDLWSEERIDPVVAPHLGGALYPPIHAVLFAPLATLRPPIAYRVLQAIVLALVFFDGWVVHRMTDRRVWWPVALVFIMIFPGFTGTINLGQNAVFSLTALLVGWWQLGRGRPVLAGICWGMLAFKPVWAASFFLVPLLTQRWRMAASMAVAGLAQIAVTLPLVGWQSWLNWLQIGQAASRDYTVQENWIFLSRDLLGIPRRWLLTFESLIARKPEEQLLPTLLGWSLWTAVLVFTLFVVWRRRRQMNALAGPPAAFVMTGVFFTCYHFMYYDFLLAALPVLLLFTEPRRYFQMVFWRRPRWLARLTGDGSAEPDDTPMRSEMRRYYQPRLDELTPPPMPLLPAGQRPRWVLAPLPPLLLLLMLILPPIGCFIDPTNHFPPGETFTLLLLWVWSGYRVLKDSNGMTATSEEPAPSCASVVLDGTVGAVQLSELGGDVGRAHEGFADQHSADAGRL